MADWDNGKHSTTIFDVLSHHDVKLSDENANATSILLLRPVTGRFVNIL